jgi:peroxin-12
MNLGVLQVAKDGLQLPADGKICPLCTRPRTNPAVVATSGFVFCYTCAFHYVTQVTKTLASLLVHFFQTSNT